MIVLDTHAWIWWLIAPNKLGRRATRSIKKANRIGVSAISVWEIAMKAKRGKLRFDRHVGQRSCPQALRVAIEVWVSPASFE